MDSINISNSENFSAGVEKVTGIVSVIGDILSVMTENVDIPDEEIVNFEEKMNNIKEKITSISGEIVANDIMNLEEKDDMNLEDQVVGKLEKIILGPMFCGKTTELYRSLTIRADLGESVAYINHTSDTRSLEIMSTHNSSLKSSSKINSIKVDCLSNVNVDNYRVIGVDEFQFYNDKSPSSIVREWINKGKYVFVSGLDGDFNMNSFGDIFNLIPLCEPGGLVKKGAVCMECYSKGDISVPAGFTKKTSNSSKQVEVGGKDIYSAVCFKCHKQSSK